MAYGIGFAVRSLAQNAFLRYWIDQFGISVASVIQPHIMRPGPRHGPMPIKWGRAGPMLPMGRARARDPGPKMAAGAGPGPGPLLLLGQGAGPAHARKQCSQALPMLWAWAHVVGTDPNKNNGLGLWTVKHVLPPIKAICFLFLPLQMNRTLPYIYIYIYMCQLSALTVPPPPRGRYIIAPALNS